MPMNPRLLVPRAAGGFDPRKISGLALWLNAQDAVLSGSNVTNWPDRSGRGLSATVHEGTPTYGATDMNGRPAVKFNGSATMLVDADVHGFSPTGQIAMFAAIKAPAPGTSLPARRPLMCGGTANNNIAACLVLRQYNGAQNYGGLITRVLQADANITSSIAVTNVRKIMSLNYNGTNGQFFLNGTQQASTSNISTTLSAGIKGNGRASIGGSITTNNADSNLRAIVDFSEIIIYSRSLTAAERIAVTDYLTALYAPE